MRNAGTEDGAPSVSINGEPVTCTALSGDANIYEFSHSVDLDGGENEISIVSNNNSKTVAVTRTVTRDDSIDVTSPETTHSISGTTLDGWYISLPEVTLSAIDAETGVAATYYRINGGSWQTYSSSVIILNQGLVTL